MFLFDKKQILAKKIVFDDVEGFLHEFDFTTIIDNFCCCFKKQVSTPAKLCKTDCKIGNEKNDLPSFSLINYYKSTYLFRPVFRFPSVFAVIPGPTATPPPGSIFFFMSALSVTLHTRAPIHSRIQRFNHQRCRFFCT